MRLLWRSSSEDGDGEREDGEAIELLYDKRVDKEDRGEGKDGVNNNIPLQFLGVQFTPEFFVLRVDEEVPHFHELAGGFVKDSLDHIKGTVGMPCCVV